MIISQNSFFDKEIKSIIEAIYTKNSCDACNEMEKYINSEINMEEWNKISDYLHQIKEIYLPEKLLPDDFPKDKLFLLSDLFTKEWNILNPNLDKTELNIILKSFFDDFDEKIEYGNRLIIDKDYLKGHALLGEYKWNDFVESLKHKNRFHSNFLNKEVLEKYCRCFENYIPENKTYLRGRIAKSAEGLPKKELEAPPIEFATAGRANSDGISRLYLADSLDTVLKEVRAGVFDYVSIAEFKAKRKIRLVDFSALDEYSPFAIGMNMQDLDLNRLDLENINKELGKPMRRSDSILDYVPTQFLIDFIESIVDKKSERRLYDGVMYKSVMNPGGINLVIFDSSIFEQQEKITTIRISSVTYHKE